MSWSIFAKGTCEEVRAAVVEEKCYEQRHGIKGTHNEAQFESAKEYILAVIDFSQSQRIEVEASGHADESSGNHQIRIRTIQRYTGGQG